MKRIKRALCIITLLCIYINLFASNTASANVPEIIRVGLSYGSSAKSSVSVSTEGDLAIYYDDNDSLVCVNSGVGAGELGISKSSGTVSCVDASYQSYKEAQQAATARKQAGLVGVPAFINGKYRVVAGYGDSGISGEVAMSLSGNAMSVNYYGDSIFIFDNADKYLNIVPKNGIIKTNSVKYRGSIELKRKDGGNFTVINRVGFEDYLKGVVPKEVSPSWNIEALKAQAVVARTYAVMQMNKYKSYGFNVDNTTASQVYGGYSAEYERSNQAVEETSGQLVLYNGKPAEVFFFATSGGMTENSENVWSGVFDYLKSVPDRYEDPQVATYYTWKTTLTADEIKSKLSSRGVHIGDIVNVEVSEYTPAGRVLTLLITGTDGTKTYTKDSCRTVLGFNSQNYTIRRENQVTKGGTYSVLTADGMKEVTINNTKILASTGVYTINAGTEITNGIENVSMNLTEEGADSGAFVFEGRGWGHGIGMSQWGAKGMADHGFNYVQIVTHYFKGTEVG